MRRHLLSVCAALFLFLLLFPATVRAADNVYAILYDDGTLTFQHGNTPEFGRTVTKTYEVDLNAQYSYLSNYEPWYNERESVRVVNFADKISPKVTVFWFFGCINLKRMDNIQNLDTANVTNTYGMFESCSGLTALDLSHFDTANVTNMREMFAHCSGLTALDVSKFDTANVTDMTHMFNGCSGLTTLDLSHFDTANVTVLWSMFYGCGGLKTIYVSDKFTTASVTDGSKMFSGCTSLIGGNGTKFDSSHTDKEYARIDTASAPGYFTASKTEPEPQPETYVITASAGEGGTVTPDGDTRIRVGGSQTYVMTPNPGYGVQSVRIDGADIGAVSEYTFKNVVTGHNIFVTFARLPRYAITAAVGNGDELSVTLENSGAVTVAVWYFDRNGKFLSADLQSVSANAGSVTFPLPFAYRARVALFDSDCCPLCVMGI